MSKNDEVKKFARKNILVDSKFQLKYTILLILVVVFFLGFFTFDSYISLKNLVSSIDIADSARQSLNQYLLVFWVKVVVLMGVLWFVSILLTHRIAGPIFRLSKDIINMANDSDLTKVFTLRENDEFKELSWSLNEFVNSLKTRLISDDNFREKVQFVVKNTLMELEKKNLSDEEKQNMVALLNRLYKESCSSPVQFKL